MAKVKIKKSSFVQKIPGGLADKKSPSDFPADKLQQGIRVELEHTSDIKIATEIAMDHLLEDPMYYDKLQKMEKGVHEMKLKIKKPLLKEELDTTATTHAAPDFTGEPDQEGEMAKNQMVKVHEYSKELLDMMSDDMQLPSWVQSKLTKIADYIGAVKHYIEGELKLQEADRELSPKQKEIAAKAPPKDEITGADFAALRKEKDLEESYIIEASCDDDELYEMELYSEECGCGELENSLEEAEYQGRKVKLNKPMRGDVKKFKVYVKDPKTGNVKKVNFGDPNMRIKKNIPGRRKSFRARHNCDNPGPKTKARYWSCRMWE